MEFGKVSLAQLPNIDFSLPPDPEFTAETLRYAPANTTLQVYVGCSSWGRKEWKGNLFPPKTKDADFLSEYARRFNCVELNATFYRMFEPETIAGWRRKALVNPHFKFCPKFNQLISHVRRLKNANDVTTAFYESMLAFEEMLGPMFLQLNDNFSPNAYQDLKFFLEGLPDDVPVFAELRHRDWFAQTAMKDAAFALMREHQTGAIITDTAGRRDCVHMHLPTPHAFIRFVGNALHPTDYMRIDQWVERLKQWNGQGLQSVYFGMHQPDETTAPVLCAYLIRRMNQELGLNLKGPSLPPPNGLLF